MKVKSIFVLLPLLLIAFVPQTAESISVMSIDLGSEFMKVAIVKPGIPMEIVLNKESRRKTPLVVSLRGIEREFGELAMQQAIKNPKTAYLFVTQILAKSLDSPAVKSYSERFPFYDIREDSETKTIYFQHDENTKYTPEELLAMILDYARELAADFGESAIDAAVITVPSYFNQAERKAVLRAAEIVQLKVLQLINSNTAAGINYGVFRRKDFNNTATSLMFFDMGSTGTVATVVSYQLVKAKDDYEANPQMTIRGIGFDQTLGGNQFTMRLAKHLAKIFLQQTKKDVFTNPKATLKLYKEAERVKNVLSANADHQAQVEGLMDDVDFKTRVTREEFENLCTDLFGRVKATIEDALKISEVTHEELTSVILVGGGTRIPKIQDEILKASQKQELGKNLNTDEAPALGAVYQAAFASKGYKVKKFYIKDYNVYPIVVDFERHVEPEEENKEQTTVRRVLFDKTNQYPQKKVMTFNKHTSDFSFRINYGDLSFLRENNFQRIGSLNLTQVSLKTVQEVFKKHANEESKGIKVHFRLDDSGILRLDKIDVTFERAGGESEQEESTLSKIGNKISSFFGGLNEENSKEETQQGSEDSQTESTTPAPETTTPVPPSTENATNQTNANNTTATPADQTAPVKNATVNLTLLREDIKYDAVDLDLIELNKDLLDGSRSKLQLIKEKEKEKRKKAAAINSLEAFIFDTRDRLSQDEFVKCSTEEERDKISQKLTEVDNWLMDADNSVETKEYNDRLNELKSVSREVFFRINEKKLRPKKLDELKETMNKSLEFFNNVQNLTGEDQPLTKVEVTALEKLINSTKEWRIKMINEQAKVLDNQQPKLLSTDVQEKLDALRREVSYLVSKIKYFRPKTKKPVTHKPTGEPTSPSNSTTSEKKPTADQEEATTQAPATDDQRSEFDKEEIDDKQFAQDIFDKFDKENQEETSTNDADAQQEPTPNPEL